MYVIGLLRIVLFTVTLPSLCMLHMLDQEMNRIVSKSLVCRLHQQRRTMIILQQLVISTVMLGSIQQISQCVWWFHLWHQKQRKNKTPVEFCYANELLVCNTNFRKTSQSSNCQSDGHSSHIDYILTRNRDRQMFITAKSFHNEEHTTQHKLVVRDFRLLRLNGHRDTNQFGKGNFETSEIHRRVKDLETL